MIAKIHKSPDGKYIAAICDENLIGKKFREKNLQLDLSSNFYRGEKRNEEETIKIMKSSHILNLVGKNTVKLALKEKIIEKENIIKIKKIPHAQALTEPGA